MDNSFFILGQVEYEIKRFHICSWDFESRKSFIELGFEINNSASLDNVNLAFTSSFLNGVKKENITCLAHRLKIRENSKFIFNDTVSNSEPISADDRTGTILTFQGRGELTILPIKKIDNDSGCLHLSVKVPQGASSQIYFRVLIELPYKTISICKEGFSKSMYFFDIKVNERRNLPDEVFGIMTDKGLVFSKINSCFCFHIIPDTFDISFVDDKKLKNIRELEYSAFKKYLPDKIKGLKNEEQMIIFCKSSDQDSYTFFSTFNKEILGSGLILFTLAANILCSLLLFFITKEEISFSNWANIPVHIKVLGVTCIAIFIYITRLLIPQIYKWILNKIKRCF